MTKTGNKAELCLQPFSVVVYYALFKAALSLFLTLSVSRPVVDQWLGSAGGRESQQELLIIHQLTIKHKCGIKS